MHRKRPRFAVLMDIAFAAFQAEIKAGIDRYLAEAEVDAVYFGLGALNVKNPNDRARLAFLEFLTPEEFDGIILLPSARYDASSKEILKKKFISLGDLPRISIGPSFFGEDSVCFDNEQGMRSIMRHLIEDHGYRRFAYVSGPFSNAEAIIRLGTYRTALEKAGIPHDKASEFEGTFHTQSGFEAVAYFLDQKKIAPEVIVCANDRMALGVWNALQQRGVSVPFDIAVTGYDDTQLSHALSNQFTTVRQSFDHLGYLAAVRLHAFIRGKKPPRPETLPTEIRVRSSCGCVDFNRRLLTDHKSTQDRNRPHAMQARIIEYIGNANPSRDEGSFLKSWIELVLEALGEDKPLYWLEECLRETRFALTDKASAARASALMPMLYAQMLEQCGQKAFVDYWDEKNYLDDLRGRLDRLQASISEDIGSFGKRELIDEIIHYLGAKEFYLVIFNDFTDVFAGAHVMYSHGEKAAGWNPSAGSWLPPECGSLVANMISVGDTRYGYYLIDSSIHKSAAFDYLRGYFSIIACCEVNRKMIEDLQGTERELRKRIAELEQTLPGGAS